MFIKFLRAIVIIALFVFALLVVAGRAGLLIEPVKNILIARIERLAGIELTIVKIEGNLVTGLRLNTVSIARNGVLQARAKTVNINYFLPALILRGTAGIELSNVEIPQLPGIRILKATGTIARTKKGVEVKRFVISSAKSGATIDAFVATGTPPHWEINANDVSISVGELVKGATGSVQTKFKLAGHNKGITLNAGFLPSQINNTRINGGQVALSLGNKKNISLLASIKTTSGDMRISADGNIDALLLNPNFALGSRNSSSDAGLFLPKKGSTVDNATLSLFSSKNSRPRSPRFSRPNAKVGLNGNAPAINFKAAYSTTNEDGALHVSGMLRKGGDNLFALAVTSFTAAAKNTLWIDGGYGMANVGRAGLKDARFTVTRGGLAAAISGEVSEGRLNMRLQSAGLPVREIQRLAAFALPSEIIPGDGTCSIDISAAGTMGSPKVEGNIVISGCRFALLSTNVEYKDLVIRLKISLSSLKPPAALITVEECSLKGGDGTADISGTLEAGNRISTNLVLHCTNFMAMDTEIFSGAIDAVIALNNNNLTGRATVRRALSNIPLKVKAPLEEIEIIYTTGTVNKNIPLRTGAPAMFAGIIMDIVITLPGAAILRVADSEAEVRGKLRARKDRNRPVYLSGEVEAVRGVIRIGERRLSIVEGSALFTGGAAQDAQINIIAESRISDALITLRLAGTIREPDIILSSDPPMDESDILSYIVFGKRLDRLAVTQEQSLHGTALDILGNIGAKGIERLVGKDIAPEEISVSPSTGAIGIGKYVTDRLYVTYEWNATDEQPRAMFDYRVNEYFSLRSQAGNPRDSGIDLLWKFSY